MQQLGDMFSCWENGLGLRVTPIDQLLSISKNPVANSVWYSAVAKLPCFIWNYYSNRITTYFNVDLFRIISAPTILNVLASYGHLWSNDWPWAISINVIWLGKCHEVKCLCNALFDHEFLSWLDLHCC